MYSFSLEVRGIDVTRPDYADLLYEAGCDDALVNVIEGKLIVDFDREADSYEDAVDSAIRDIEKAGGKLVEIHRLAPLY